MICKINDVLEYCGFLVGSTIDGKFGFFEAI